MVSNVAWGAIETLGQLVVHVSCARHPDLMTLNLAVRFLFIPCILRQDPETTNLYVGNLSPEITEEILFREFAKFGPIQVRLPLIPLSQMQ